MKKKKKKGKINYQIMIMTEIYTKKCTSYLANPLSYIVGILHQTNITDDIYNRCHGNVDDEELKL